jgi:hypothetical protein
MTSLSCESIRERLADGDDDAELRAHAEACPDCRPILAALSEIDDALDALPAIDAPDALVERVVATVREEKRGADLAASEAPPSLLGAAFAILTSALGALVTAPLAFFRWLVGVGTAKPDAGAIDDRGKTAPARGGFGFGMAPTLALGSVLIVVIAWTTFATFGSRVRTRSRGAESVVNGLPVTTDEESTEGGRGLGDGWWQTNDDPNAPVAVAPTPTARDWAQAELPPSDDDDESVERQLGMLGHAGGQGRMGPSGDDGIARGAVAGDLLEGAIDVPAYGQDIDRGGRADGDRGEAAAGPTHAHHGGTFAWSGEGQPETYNGTETDAPALVPQLETTPAQTQVPPPETPEPPPAARLRLVERPAAPATGATAREQAAVTDESQLDALAADQQQIDRDGELRGRDGREGRLPSEFRSALAGPWELAQATTGLTFASSESWWANTYVPGDAQLRMLHARLAASPGPLSGSTLDALSLAELASPTTPAVAAPSDRALALGVHADTAAIEGPTRVRMEIALRAIDQAAGRRGPMRVAIVVDARNGLGTDEQAHLRSLLGALSHSLTPRDRVILTAAGRGGGTLVPLGVLRHGQVEVALRHLADAGSITGEAIPTSLEDALAAGLEAATGDDGAGLALLVTPDGSHDAAVDQALHLGAIAGVPTTAVGIGAGASTASLDPIALAGEGRRRLVLSDDDAARAVREELSAASRLVARALRVRVHLADGVQLVDVVGSHALDADETRRTRESEHAIDVELARRLGIGQDRDEDDSGVRILVPSFYAGDSHTIVLDLLVSRPGPVADVDVRFKDLVRLGNGTASSALTLEAGTAPRGPHELRVVASYVGHAVAGALESAADAIERGDLGAARAQLSDAQALVVQARDAVPGLASVRSTTTDQDLLTRFLAAVDSATDPQLVASSLHYAAARRIVIPQLQASTP